MYARCPLCGSSNVERRTHMYEVYYYCRNCGHQFKK